MLTTYRRRSYSLLSLLRTRALVSGRRLNRLNKLNRFLGYLTLTLTSARRRFVFSYIGLLALLES